MPVRVVAILAGLAWLARGLLALTEPMYYAPVTAADYAAVALTSVGLALLAPSLWFLAASSGRNSRIAGAVGAVASAIAAAANFVEDALHVPAFWTVYVVGASGVALALVGMAVLLMRAGSRWHAAVAILSLIGFFASSIGGEMLVGLAWLAAGSTRLLSRGVREHGGVMTAPSR